MTSSVSDAVEAEDEADFRAARRASEGRAIVMTFAALDWMRYPVKSASTLICLCRTIQIHVFFFCKRVERWHLRPDLNPTLVRVTIADYVHAGLGELDDAFLLQFFDGLDDFWIECR